MQAIFSALAQAGAEVTELRDPTVLPKAQKNEAEQALGIVTSLAGRAPRGVAWGLVAATALVTGPLEVAIVGDVDDPGTGALRRIALMATSPGAVVAAAMLVVLLWAVVIIAANIGIEFRALSWAV